MDTIAQQCIELSVSKCKIMVSEGKYFHNRFVSFCVEEAIWTSLGRAPQRPGLSMGRKGKM